MKKNIGRDFPLSPTPDPGDRKEMRNLNKRDRKDLRDAKKSIRRTPKYDPKKDENEFNYIKRQYGEYLTTDQLDKIKDKRTGKIDYGYLHKAINPNKK